MDDLCPMKPKVEDYSISKSMTLRRGTLHEWLDCCYRTLVDEEPGGKFLAWKKLEICPCVKRE